MDLARLRQRCEQGETFTYLYFWGHTEAKGGPVTKACLSQWYPADFTVAGVRYHNAEQYMMVKKAELFGDATSQVQIMAATTAKEIKALGRLVKGFDGSVWSAEAEAIVCAANLAKFGQNPALAAYLRQTDEAVLVEASPVDAIWGIGLAEGAAGIEDPLRWPGKNLLGFALMAVRAELA